MKLRIYFKTSNKEINDKIRARFGITSITNVNRETVAEIEEPLLPLLLEVEKRGFIQIRTKINRQ